MVIEQEECQKVETLFWMWRTFAASDEEAHRVEAVALVQRVLAKAWGVELPPDPLDFGAARKVAKRATRRLEDLPLAWREA